MWKMRKIFMRVRATLGNLKGFTVALMDHAQYCEIFFES